MKQENLCVHKGSKRAMGTGLVHAQIAPQKQKGYMIMRQQVIVQDEK